MPKMTRIYHRLPDVFARVCPLNWRPPLVFLKCRVNLDKLDEKVLTNRNTFGALLAF